MPADRATELFEAMLAAANAFEEDSVKQLVEQARAEALSFSVETDEDEPEYDLEGMGGGTMDVVRKLYLGKTIVAEWNEWYSGFYGGGGTGWWVGRDGDDNKPDGLDDFLEYAGIELKSPDFPAPELEDEEADEA